MGNTFLDYTVLRDIGWLSKAGFNVDRALGIAGAALGAGGIGYGAFARKKIKDMEDKRELVGVVSDSIARERLGDLYEMAGMGRPDLPIGVTKNVAPKYQDIIKGR